MFKVGTILDYLSVKDACKLLEDVKGEFKKMDLENENESFKNVVVWEKVPDNIVKLGDSVVERFVGNDGINNDNNMEWKGRVGIYRRKAKTYFKTNSKQHLRIIVHVGDPEVYYLKKGREVDQVILKSLDCVVLPSEIAKEYSISISSNPVRKKFKGNMIRKRNYVRYVILLDSVEMK